MTAPVISVALVGPVLALVLVIALMAVAIFSRRSGGDDDELRTPPLGRAFVVGSLAGGAFLAGGDALAALVLGAPVLLAAAAGFAAGALASPLVLGSLLAGHATVIALTVPFLANAGALAVAVAL